MHEKRGRGRSGAKVSKTDTGEMLIDFEFWLDVVAAYDRKFGLPAMAPHLLAERDRARLVRHMRRALKNGKPVAARILNRYAVEEGALS